MSRRITWQGLRVKIGRLRADIETLSQIGRSPTGTLTRHGFSRAYEQARIWLKERMRHAGLAVRDDSAGNTVGRMGSTVVPCVMSGSHIDTVTGGGPLDGALGVLAAVEVARVINESSLDIPKPFECVAFMDEEGRFLDCLGSRAMTGEINPQEINAATDPEGNRLVEVMRSAGFDPDAVTRARRPKGSIAAYVELHIEQGPVLEDKGIPIGIVNVIHGINYADITFHGEPAHAGTTPMEIRRDAFMGAAEYAYRVRQMVMDENSLNRTRVTFGIVDLKPQVANIVPFEVRLFQEIRDGSVEFIDTFVSKAKTIARDTAHKHRLEVEYAMITENKPATMSDEIRAVIHEATTDLGLESYDMPSGAAHDAQVIARTAPAGMIFVPSHGGHSHRRDEWTDWPLIENGANVLLQSVLRLIHGQTAGRL